MIAKTEEKVKIKAMKEKRYKVIKDNGAVKPLQSRTTNIKFPTVESLLKSSKPALSNVKHSSKSSSKERKKAAEKQDSKTRKQSATIFNSENVTLKLVSQNPFNKASEKVVVNESLVKPGRLKKIDEEENSLKIEDFDEPPQSTSTPILGSSSYNSLQDFTSPHGVDVPYQVSPVLYAYNPVSQQHPYAFPYPYVYSHPVLTNDSPIQNKIYQDQLKSSYNHRIQSIPTQPQFMVHPCSQIQMSYPIMESNDSRQLPYAVNKPIFLPQVGSNYGNSAEVDFLAAGPQRYTAQSNGFKTKDGDSSGSPSYKSSGGDATYHGSAKS